MGRIIDEDDVLEVLCRELCHPGAICPDGYCEEMREKLKDVPTVHPEQPKIGKWRMQVNPKRECYGHWECCECGTAAWEKSRYCAGCGAKMEG